ncbi:hypothetical protein V1527DRAFT_453176 [Lipomyces starkeyi]
MATLLVWLLCGYTDSWELRQTYGGRIYVNLKFMAVERGWLTSGAERNISVYLSESRIEPHLYRDTLTFAVIDVEKTYHGEGEDAYAMKKDLSRREIEEEGGAYLTEAIETLKLSEGSRFLLNL